MKTLEDVMSRSVLRLTPSLPASDAWAEMCARGVRHAVVVRSGDIVGVISDRDLEVANARARSRSRMKSAFSALRVA
jgi:CBS domain-containing protein